MSVTSSDTSIVIERELHGCNYNNRKKNNNDPVVEKKAYLSSPDLRVLHY